MVERNIVFIEKLDSNLHDVYLCTMLEYLMEHGEGQSFFTTHNIRPMDRSAAMIWDAARQYSCRLACLDYNELESKNCSLLVGKTQSLAGR